MVGEARTYGFTVSVEMFKLITESVRLYSNETTSAQTLSNLVNLHAPALPGKLDQFDLDALRKHLDLTPSDGTIKLNVRLTKQASASLVEARERFSILLECKLTLADALSALLFKYLAEQAVAAFLRSKGLMNE